MRAAKQITKEDVIDLSLPEAQRWAYVIKKEKLTAKKLVANAKDQIPSFYLKSFRGVFAAAYKLFGGLYMKELEAWARGIRCSSKELLMLNCSYELAHTAGKVGAILGCTAGVLRAGKSRAVLVRNMDWPIKGLGKATRIYRFVGDSHEFVAVGAPALVGVLSGMVPGAYAATINYAPPTALPFFNGFGPLFLLRHVFENCTSYDEAVEMLSGTKLSANVLFTLASADGRSCSVERTRGEYVIRPSREGRIAVANHFQSGALKSLNKELDADIVEWSNDRSQTMLDGLKTRGASLTMRQLKALLDREPVLNDETCQQMIFDPARGKLTVWGR
jgi:predicted choloylglycine hydrolase